MKAALLPLIILLLLSAACHKNEKPAIPENHYGEIFSVSFMLDNTQVGKAYSADKINSIQGYTDDQGNGNYYFGGGPAYALDNQGLLQIQLGSAYGPVTTKWDSAFASFVQLCAPGSKIYDVIKWVGQRQMNRVELTYKDPAGDLWSTTKIDATVNPPKLASPPAQQNGSSFIITYEKQVSLDNTKNNAVIIKGTFNCILYKYNTYEQKQITKGTFTGIFAVI